MEIFYDKHEKNYNDYQDDSKKRRLAKSWLNKNTLDYWRHERMLDSLQTIINKGDTWLTIGDGRYGSEAIWLQSFGIKVHASDLWTNLLEESKKIGLIKEFSKQNAENLTFKDNSFDYVLIKESLHHLPRPWLAIYEAFRVCRKGVVLIEPNDCFVKKSLSKKYCLQSIKNIMKRILKKKIFAHNYNFEEVGNFIYTINLRELEKFLLGMHKIYIASNFLNDHHIKGIEFVNQGEKNTKKRFLLLNLKLKIFLKDFLCKFGFLNYSILEVILFKNLPDKETINKINKSSWNFKTLPKNPYI